MLTDNNSVKKLINILQIFHKKIHLETFHDLYSGSIIIIKIIIPFNKVQM